MKYIKKLLNLILGYKNHRIVRIKKRGPTGVDLDYDFQFLVGDEKITCLDIGANKGQTIDIFLSLFNKPTIHAFEPSSKQYEWLSSRKKTMGDAWSEVHLHQSGMGSKKSTQTFNNYGNSTLSSILPLQDTERNPYRDDIHYLENTEIVTIDTVDDFMDNNNIQFFAVFVT